MNWKRVGLLIREARERHGLSQDGLAESAGVSRATVSKIEGGVEVRWGGLYTVAKALGLTHDPIILQIQDRVSGSLSSGENISIAKPDVRSKTTQSHIDIPVFTVTSGTLRGTVPLDRGFVINTLNANPDKIVAFPISDDEMSPTLNPGEVALVELGETSHDQLKSGAHLVLVDGVPSIKRINRHPEGKVEVRADNPNYGAYIAILAMGALQILGRVVGSIRKI